MEHEKLSEKEEALAKQIVDIAVKIHMKFGPGLLESIYKKCFYHELQRRGLNFEKEVSVPLFYNGLKIDDGLRLDCCVDYTIIIEFKAQEKYNPLWKAQLMSYMKLYKVRLGFLLNFHVPLMKDGVTRIIL